MIGLQKHGTYWGQNYCLIMTIQYSLCCKNVKRIILSWVINSNMTMTPRHCLQEDCDNSNNSSHISKKSLAKLINSNDSDELVDLEYFHLANSMRHKKENVCLICANPGGDVINCTGVCSGSYHVDCLGLKQTPEGFLCDECATGKSKVMQALLDASKLMAT